MRLDLLHKFSNLCPKEIVITSANDSKHSNNSKHYLNEALDLRSHNFMPGTKIAFREELERFLNIGSPCPFTVLLEGLDTPNEHFHVQVKKGYRCP
jgi:hypothetical protein